jgi:arylformamidase
MRFAPLPPQSPIYPEEAAIYARATLERSEEALARCERIGDLAYGSDYWQAVDVYRPRTAPAGGAPVLVFAHGGAWTNGYKEWMGLMAPALTDAGIVFVSVSYRLAPEHKWKAMLDDCLDAVAWVARHIHQHGGDPIRLALGGHSAGGHLMALAALSPEALQARGVARPAIVACLPLCAPLDIRYPDRQPGSGEERTHQMILDDSAEAPAASPICLVRPDSPFMLLAHARDDLPRIVKGSRAMAAELDRLGVPHEAIEVEGDHFSAALDAADPESPWMQRAIRLLRT